MANPQLENGYVRIATEIYDALARTRIPGEARQMFDLIIRKTYGYGKKEDRISTSQIMNETGLSRPRVAAARRKLIEMNLITVSQKGYIRSYKLQKNHEAWNCISKKIQVYPKKDTKCIPKQTPQYKKDNKQKKTAEPYWARFSQDTQEKLKSIKAINIYLLLGRLRKERKIDLPEGVVIRIINSYQKQQGSIRNPWAWFLKVAAQEWSSWNAERNIKESQKLKTARIPQSIRDIIANNVTNETPIKKGRKA